jgi:hypothetical protein
MTLLKRRAQLDTSDTPCGDQSTQKSRGNREEQRESEHVPIERHRSTALADSWDGDARSRNDEGVRSGIQPEKCPHREWAHHQADNAASQRQENVLDQNLPHDPATAGAQGSANRHLSFSNIGPNQQQAGNVCAGNQQQERN